MTMTMSMTTGEVRDARTGPLADVSVQMHSRDTATAVVTGELDLATATRIAGIVLGAVDLGARHVVMDLSGVAFCDSQGLNAFVRIADRAEGLGGGITLTGVRPGTARLLQVTGLDRRFAVGSSLDCAAPAA